MGKNNDNEYHVNFHIHLNDNYYNVDNNFINCCNNRVARFRSDDETDDGSGSLRKRATSRNLEEQQFTTNDRCADDRLAGIEHAPEKRFCVNEASSSLRARRVR